MWFFPTKKELNQELDMIKLSFDKRDQAIKLLTDRLETNSLKIATLEGSYFVLANKPEHQSQAVLKQHHSKFETKLLNRIQKSKKSLIMAEILKLLDNHTTLEIYETIVKEKELCSKASFYRYMSSLKSQRLIMTETNTN